jgi:hypothetical protein
MVGMFERLLVDWADRKPRDVYKKVRDFMYYYAINRHKMTTITPGLYLENYTPDDNRYDLRPFLYTRFAFEHRKIENMLKKVSRRYVYVLCKLLTVVSDGRRGSGSREWGMSWRNLAIDGLASNYTTIAFEHHRTSWLV